MTKTSYKMELMYKKNFDFENKNVSIEKNLNKNEY